MKKVYDLCASQRYKTNYIKLREATQNIKDEQ